MLLRRDGLLGNRLLGLAVARADRFGGFPRRICRCLVYLRNESNTQLAITLQEPRTARGVVDV